MARHGDAMVRASTEQLVPQQNQALLPCVYRHRRRALARWIVGTLVAGNATGSALVHVLATAEIARATTLADAWKAWIAAPAQHLTAPPAADAPPVVSSACVWHRPAPLERCALNRQTAGARPGCLLSTRCHRPPAHACSLLRPRPTARLGDRPIALPGRVGTAGGADAALGPPCPATRPGGRSADGSRGVEPALVVCDPVAAVLSGHAGACYLDRRADRSGGGSQCRAWCQVQDLEPIWDILSQKEIGWGAAALRPYLYQVSSAVS